MFAERATPLPELTQEALNYTELKTLFERSVHQTPLSSNNHFEMHIDPKQGEVYIFNLPEGKGLHVAKTALMNLDPYVWHNNGVHGKRFGISKSYYINKDHDGGKTSFTKQISIHYDYRKAIVEYLGSHTTGITKCDKHYEAAVQKWCEQEIDALSKNRQKRQTTSQEKDHVAKKKHATKTPQGSNEPAATEGDSTEARAKFSPTLEPNLEGEAAEGSEEDTRSIISVINEPPTLAARLRAAQYPMLSKPNQVSEALPKCTKVTPPGIPLEIHVIKNYLTMMLKISMTFVSLQ